MKSCYVSLFWALFLWIVFSYSPLVKASTLSCKQIFKEDFSNLKNWAPGTTLSIYRFFDNKTNTRAHVASYKLFDGMFTPFHGGNMEVTGSRVKQSELIERLQNFSTQVMVEKGIITPETRDRQPKLLDDIGPSQLTFVEISQAVPKDSKISEKYPDHRISDLAETTLPGHQFIREAGMWLISGQYTYRELHDSFTQHGIREGPLPWKVDVKVSDGYDVNDPFLVKLAIHTLPWQRNPEIIEKGSLPINIHARIAELDRTRFPIAFEIGRAAQVKPGRFSEMMKVLSSIMFEEVDVMLHGRAEDAYVFANIANPKLIPRYLEEGFKILEGACIRSTLCVMYIPLVEFGKRYPPHQNSHQVLSLKEYFPEAENTMIHQLLLLSQSALRSELDFLLPQLNLIQKTPIVMQDLTNLNRNIRRILAFRMGVEKEKLDDLVWLLGEWQKDFEINDKTAYVDTVPLEPFAKRLQEGNFIRITNLDPEFNHRQDYVPLLLGAFEGFLRARLQEWKITADPVQALHQLEVKFLIQTTSPDMAANVRQHLGKSEWPPEVLHDGRTVYSFTVNRSIILDFFKSHPELEALLLDQGIAQGHWFFRAANKVPWKY